MSEKITVQDNCFTVRYEYIPNAITMPVELESAIYTKDKITVSALWDTGTNISVIKHETAEKLDLKCVSMEEKYPSEDFISAIQ